MLRPATDGDVDAMLRWRNQPANRVVSINDHEIDAAEHAAWWAAASTDPRRRVLVYEHADTPCGVVNFFGLTLAAAPRTGGWGFYLDADGLAERAATIPAWLGLMREATAYAFDRLRLDVLRGEVLEHNTAVRQMNRRFRFVEGPPATRTSGGRTVTVIPISRSRQPC